MKLEFFSKISSYQHPTQQTKRLPFILHYYLTESKLLLEEHQTEEIPLNAYPTITYGICIRKLDPATSPKSFLEEAIVRDITTDRSTAESILAIFSKNVVTPCELDDVLEDYLGSSENWLSNDSDEGEGLIGA